jgi:hypothetical protein
MRFHYLFISSKNAFFSALFFDIRNRCRTGTKVVYFFKIPKSKSYLIVKKWNEVYPKDSVFSMAEPDQLHTTLIQVYYCMLKTMKCNAL